MLHNKLAVKRFIIKYCTHLIEVLFFLYPKTFEKILYSIELNLYGYIAYASNGISIHRIVHLTLPTNQPQQQQRHSNNSFKW